ncbi:MAG: tRNA (N(6)-L-threonylcarbamoyladenosine(37)-C(2))-methylthiotransferase [Candidatus Hodarchaeota archaeon]
MVQLESRKKAIKVLNYGCSANRAIAEGLMGILQRNGYQITESVNDAEVVVVNTCVVKQNTEHRMKSQLLWLSQTKEIVVTGCLPVVMRDWISQNLPNTKVLYPEVANQIVDLLQDHPIEKIKIADPHKWSRLYTNDRLYYNPVISTIEISRGCLGKCSFCIVKAIKGKLRSRSQEIILSEILTALQNGCKEVWLTSQDTGVYGWDFSPKQYLPSLIENITSLRGKFFVRLGMMTPITLKKFLNPLINQLNNNKVFSFLHLPIQSGSDSVLRAMKRKETLDYYITLLNKLKQEIDELVLATDIIVGFPGESFEDFEETKELLRKIKPEIVNVSKYTDRIGTLASKMQNKIPTNIKADRSRELAQLTQKITKDQLSKWLGWEGIVLIDEFGKKPSQFVGRNSSYLPVVVSNEEISLGQFCTVRITDSGSTYLIGEITNGF